MWERFTDQARRVVVLAQEEARMLDHNFIGTEHILLGLLREGDGIAAKALESLGISLDAARQQVEEIIGRGQQAVSGRIPFTPRTKKVLELSLRESLQLGHDYIGTEHILLGLIREGDGVAAQVLVRLGADLNRVRQQVIQLLHGYQGKEPSPSWTGASMTEVLARLHVVEGRLAALDQRVGTAVPRGRKKRLLASQAARQEQPAAEHPNVVEVRLAALEQRVGTGPDTSDLDDQIAQAGREKESAVDARDYEQAAERRNREKELLAAKAARQEQWAARHPMLPVLAERVQQLADEVERLRVLLRQHGIDPQDKPA